MKTQHQHAFLNIKCQSNYPQKKDNNNKRSFYELSLSLIFSLWCLLFLFYSKLGLGHGNGEINASSSSISSRGLSQKVAKPMYSHADTSRLEQVFWKVLGNTHLVCELKAEEEKKLEAVQVPYEKDHHTHDLNYEELRNITTQEESQGIKSQLVNITRRLEPDGSEYNYASESKGAKVVAHNKEAKGASNILGKDHDKYLRNPCSVGGKFVVIELAEETLVDSVKIANFEHYSSNFKDFELSSSLTYPTETWSPLGHCHAANVKHAQIFKLPEPKWARYLNLSLLSHYGSEFYCTLSVVEVYGINAIERMLEDLIVASVGVGSIPNKLTESNSSDIPSLKPEIDRNVKQVESRNDSAAAETPNNDVAQKIEMEGTKNPVIVNKVPDPVMEFRQQLNGRVAGDTVLKILMQKVMSVELNLSALEEYLKEMNRRQGDIIPDLEKELSRISQSLEQSKTEIDGLLHWNTITEKGISELELWKDAVSSQVDALVKENRVLRLDVQNIRSDQVKLQSKELAVLVVSLLFVCLAVFKLIWVHILTFFGAYNSEKARQTIRGLVTLFVCCCLTIMIVMFYS
ncbi:hypothetical protein L6164_028340 [Bauhinia variegata]|uniref:Uncharacterized protein n=1 Tax=Bauhinia variegata TaxID=167791 RepID=A0ACB9LVJ8_BAUVA|nr:hypothetical protein L6164_028340 [Bauhinia variegata]